MATAVQKEIGGRKFSFARCSAMEAIDLELSLARAGLAELGNMDSSALDSEEGMTMGLAGAIGRMTKNLSVGEVARLMGIVFKYTSCEGKTIGETQGEFNVVFADRPWDIWEAFVEGLIVNLGPFVVGIRTRFKALMVKAEVMQKANQSGPTT